MIGRLLMACGIFASAPAFANDSIAELGTGGLVLSRTDAISMAKEDLFISMDRVTVDYVFRNVTDKDVNAIVAFPMPLIEANPYSMPALPDDTSDNFLGFKVSVGGKAVSPQLEQRAFAVEVDVTDLLAANNVPVNPFAEPVLAALEKLPQKTANDWIDRGLIFIDSYDDGSGWKNVRTPLWSLKSTYWWNATFPAGKDVRVSHDYKPSVGGTAGLNFFTEGGFNENYAAYKQKYCIDGAFERAVKKAAAESPDGYPRLMEWRIDYVLTTGGNWALGNIGDFRLTVDKGDPKNLVSFCAAGVKKTGPATFETRQTDFYPQRDIEILILKGWDEVEPMAAKAPARKLEGASRAFDAKAKRPAK
jgi:hypothetical protein